MDRVKRIIVYDCALSLGGREVNKLSEALIVVINSLWLQRP